MTKFRYLIFLGSALMFIISGCSESFLEVESKTQETLETYFTTDESIQEAVVAAYGPLQWPDWAFDQFNPVLLMSDFMADDIWVGGADRNDNQFMHLMMNYEATPNNCMTGLWTVAYSGVKRSNDVIQYLDWNKGKIKEENAKYYEAQARVLRVFYYNWLWKFWGNIPYFDVNLESPYIADQFTADEIYQKIIKDLEETIALEALPLKETSNNFGRVTQAMAYMLYAEIVMYQNDESRFSKALEYMNEIIDSGQYELMADYNEIFEVEGEWSDESIFEINYKSENGVRGWGNPLGVGGMVTPRLIGPSEWADGVAGYDNGWGFAPVRTELYEIYTSNDDRRTATCWNAANDGKFNARYQNTDLFLRKYIGRNGGNAGHNADGDMNYNNNLRIYRYSETLLNAAELIVRGAGAGDAKALLNEVRSRATGSESNIDATLDNILRERRLEFVGEGKRYWDLVRSGKAEATLVPDEYGYRTNSWTSSKKYLPIPQGEVDSSQGTMKQNNY